MTFPLFMYRFLACVPFHGRQYHFCHLYPQVRIDTGTVFPLTPPRHFSSLDTWTLRETRYIASLFIPLFFPFPFTPQFPLTLSSFHSSRQCSLSIPVILFLFSPLLLFDTLSILLLLSKYRSLFLPSDIKTFYHFPIFHPLFKLSVFTHSLSLSLRHSLLYLLSGLLSLHSHYSLFYLLFRYYLLI